MGVYIKGMEMPTNCMDCPFKGFDRVKGRGNICTINDSITLHAVLDGIDIKFVRMGDCPLMPVPPHGIIDREQILDSIRLELAQANAVNDMEDYDSWMRVFDYVRKFPTIIPAEERER